MQAHDVPLTVRQAADFFHVERSTVWTWVHRYKLEPVGRRYGEPGRPKLYRFGDLARAERLARSYRPGRRRSLNPEMFA